MKTLLLSKSQSFSFSQLSGHFFSCIFLPRKNTSNKPPATQATLYQVENDSNLNLIVVKQISGLVFNRGKQTFFRDFFIIIIIHIC